MQWNQDQSLTTSNKRPNATACSIPKIRFGRTKTNVHTFNQCLWTTTNVSLIWAFEERKVDGFAHRVLPCQPVIVNQAVHLQSLPMSASRQELTVSSKSSSTKLAHEEYCLLLQLRASCQMFCHGVREPNSILKALNPASACNARTQQARQPSRASLPACGGLQFPITNSFRVFRE